MTTNKTTNKNTNTATMIDENRFFKCVAPFLFSHSQVIGYLGTFGKNATKKFKDSLSFISQVPF